MKTRAGQAGYTSPMEYDPLPEPHQTEPPDAGPPPEEPPADDLSAADSPPPPDTSSAGEPSPAADVDPRQAERRRRLRHLVVYPLLTTVVAAATGIAVAASIHRPQVETLDDFVPKLITRLYDHAGKRSAPTRARTASCSRRAISPRC